MTPRDVMLIDDDEADVFLHRLALKESGLVGEIVSMQRAQDALEYLKNTPHDLGAIFLDINMPVMDGFQFLDAYEDLTKAEQARAILVMLTSSLRPVDRERAEDRGVVIDYLAKPLQVDDVRRVFERLDAEAAAAATR